jgi:HD-GYP domain-containing protein (c-di-GMP phosphodiesterase class II)
MTVKPGLNTLIPTGELKLGMFVAELDRPWLETPFLLQGFRISDSDQIALLQRYCRHVRIDRTRSTGEQYQAKAPHERDAPLQGIALGAHEPASTQKPDFMAVARNLHGRKSVSRRSDVPPVVRDGQSDIEAELMYSAPIIDDVHKTLQSIQEAINDKTTVDLDQVRGLVEEVAAGVERNPDAMIWLTRLRKTDQYSYDHAIDVSVHLMIFARFLGLAGPAVENLGLAGLMQDIGKTMLNPEILSKPSALTEEEYELTKSHVASSLDLLVGQRDFPVDVLTLVAAHHERFDGSGYPRRIGGAKLRFPAELPGLIDTYCAMTRHRVYIAPVSNQKALEELVKMRGTKFKETLVDQFIQCVGLYPIGTLLELNTGEVAVVIQQNQVRRLKPRVLVMLAEDKSIQRHPRTLDLINDPLTPIGEPYRILHALPTHAYGIDWSEFFLD